MRAATRRRSRRRHQAQGGEVALVHGDVSDAAAVKKIVADTIAAFGRIDVLVNNAGGMLGRVVTTEMDDAHYDKVMRLNCWSVFALTREAPPH